MDKSYIEDQMKEVTKNYNALTEELNKIVNAGNKVRVQLINLEGQGQMLNKLLGKFDTPDDQVEVQLDPEG